MLTFSLLAGVEESAANGAVSQQLAICDSSTYVDLALTPTSGDAVCPAAVSQLEPLTPFTRAITTRRHCVGRIETTRHIRAPPSFI
ncbi:hypothetical protein [Marinobacterium lutimaris]|uniref:hypothetical protein n=1 Tax=Marinobacterium lutimaris TaxID=568106 RepID=UPI0011B0D0E5|nr:hypothetical protein [Marinobacterium lutimaris]